MVLSVSISPEAEAKLKRKAAAAGVDLSTYVSSLVEQNAEAPLTLREISGPVAEAFAQGGMTEDELGDFLEKEKHQMRAERRQGPER